MRQRGHRHLLDVIGDDVVALVQHGLAAGQLDQGQAAARAGAHLHLRVVPGRPDDGHDVVEQVRADLHPLERVPHGQHTVRAGHRVQLNLLAGAGHPPAEHVGLVAAAQVAEPQPHQEPVELGLGQLVGALVLDRVVRGQDDERLRQQPGLPVHADLALAHGLEQRRLGLRRRPVDLVGQQQLGEHRPRPEHHVGRPLVIQRSADHVGRQQVGGELDAGEIQAEHPGEGPGDQGLAQPGQVLEQDVAARQDADQDQLEGPAAADDRALELVQHGRAGRGGLFGSHHSFSNRSTRRARVRRGMPRRRAAASRDEESGRVAGSIHGHSPASRGSRHSTRRAASGSW